MKRMAAGKFKANCLAIMDEVQSRRESVIITKRGKPVAKLVPVPQQSDELSGFLAGKGEIAGDIVSPVFDLAEWNALR